MPWVLSLWYKGKKHGNKEIRGSLGWGLQITWSPKNRGYKWEIPLKAQSLGGSWHTGAKTWALNWPLRSLGWPSYKVHRTWMSCQLVFSSPTEAGGLVSQNTLVQQKPGAWFCFYYEKNKNKKLKVKKLFLNDSLTQSLYWEYINDDLIKNQTTQLENE